MSSDQTPGIATPAAGLLEFLLRLWRRRVFLLAVMVPAAVVAVAIALLLPPKYEASATLLPDLGAGGAPAVSGGLGSLAGLAGLRLGGPGVDLYPVVGRSRRVLDRTLATSYGDVNLALRLNDGAEPDTLEAFLIRKNLRGALRFAKDLRSESLTLRYRHRDPDVAVAVVNAVIFEMERYFADKAHAQARTELELTRTRLTEVAAELAAAEEGLRDFRTRNRDLLGSPARMLQEARLQREVEIRNRVYVELVSREELVKIQDATSTGTLDVLDRAVHPMVKAWPRRSYVVLVIVAVAFLLAAGWVELAWRWNGLRR